MTLAPTLFEPHGMFGTVDPDDGEPFPFGYLSKAQGPLPLFEIRPVLGWPVEEMAAYANVFATAPDMLAEFKRIFEDWPELDTDEPINGGDMVDWFCAFAERIRALIARAEGQ